MRAHAVSNPAAEQKKKVVHANIINRKSHVKIVQKVYLPTLLTIFACLVERSRLQRNATLKFIFILLGNISVKNIEKDRARDEIKQLFKKVPSKIVLLFLLD